jgi:hypothetical protein
VSNDKVKFADDIERFLRMFPGIAAYAAKVREVGQLEQQAEEAANSAAAARAEANTLADSREQVLAAARREAGEIKDKANDVLKAVEHQTRETLDRVKIEGEKVRAEAVKNVDDKLSAAHALLQNMEISLEGVTRRRDAMLGTVDRLENDRANLQIEIVALKEQHDRINQHIADLKARFG